MDIVYPYPGTPYVNTPWADPTGTLWLYRPAKNQWDEVPDDRRFEKLVDRQTADIPGTNLPLKASLAAKVDSENGSSNGQALNSPYITGDLLFLTDSIDMASVAYQFQDGLGITRLAGGSGGFLRFLGLTANRDITIPDADGTLVNTTTINNATLPIRGTDVVAETSFVARGVATIDYPNSFGSALFINLLDSGHVGKAIQMVRSGSERFSVNQNGDVYCYAIDATHVVASGDLQVNGNSTLVANVTINGQLTANNQTLALPGRVVTRALGDVRYLRQIDATAVNDEPGPANSTAFQTSTQCIITLPVGRYLIEAFGNMLAHPSGTSLSKVMMDFSGTGTASGLLFRHGPSTLSNGRDSVPAMKQDGSRVYNSTAFFNSGGNTGGVMHNRFPFEVTVAGDMRMRFGCANAVSGEYARLLAGSYIQATYLP
jgi:hypothetical protein